MELDAQKIAQAITTTNIEILIIARLRTLFILKTMRANDRCYFICKYLYIVYVKIIKSSSSYLSFTFAF